MLSLRWNTVTLKKNVFSHSLKNTFQMGLEPSEKNEHAYMQNSCNGTIGRGKNGFLGPENVDIDTRFMNACCSEAANVLQRRSTWNPRWWPLDISEKLPTLVFMFPKSLKMISESFKDCTKNFIWDTQVSGLSIGDKNGRQSAILARMT